MTVQEVITAKATAVGRGVLWKEVFRNPSALIGLILVLLTFVTAVFGHWMAPHNPTAIHLSKHLIPPWGFGGTSQYILGTDYLGRDELSQIIVATGPSILYSIVAVIVSLIIGTILGLYGGYFGGWIGNIVTFLIDTSMAYPFILLALTLMAVAGPGPGKLVAALAFSGWPSFARVIRSEAMHYRESMFVEAAHAIGSSHARIIFRHLLPNVGTVVIVIATMNIAINVLLEAGLTFIGLGLNASTPTWGSMLANSRDYIQSAWWLAVLPGVAIMLSVIGFNLVGDWLRDLWDPRT